jgi:hypothetical protein
MRAMSFSNQSSASPALGSPTCFKPCGDGRIQGTSPTSDQASSLTLPAAMVRASGFVFGVLSPKKNKWKCMSAR